MNQWRTNRDIHRSEYTCLSPIDPEFDISNTVSPWPLWDIAAFSNMHISHYNDVIMGAITSQITSLTTVYSIVYADQRKHQRSASLAFVRGIHRSPVNSPHKWPVTQKVFPFDDVIMTNFVVIEFVLRVFMNSPSVAFNRTSLISQHWLM